MKRKTHTKKKNTQINEIVIDDDDDDEIIAYETSYTFAITQNFSSKCKAKYKIMNSMILNFCLSVDIYFHDKLVITQCPYSICIAVITWRLQEWRWSWRAVM